MKKILVTGTSSYIGNNFIRMVDKFDFECEKTSLRNEGWRSKSFQGYDAILHVAAIVHQSKKKSSYDIYDKVNHQLTIELATKAKEDGVKQFIFLSTMSVYGLNTGHITDFTPLKPISLYGQSKLKAEEDLRALNSENFTVTIIRPPMVYGPNCKGNFNTLNKIANISPIFPKLQNARSAIYIDNLSELLKVVIDDRIGGTLLPQNDEYLNTSKTVSQLAKTSSKRLYLSKLGGLGVNLFMSVPTIQKAFGSLTYNPNLAGGPNHLQYNIVDFEKSILQSVQLSHSSSMGQKLSLWQRPLDIAFSSAGLVAASPLLIAATVVGYCDTGSPLFVQERIGKDQKPFKLIKFRTMKVTTESVASHLVDSTSITKLGKILRKTKLDELPQLVNVLKGEMSLVGPRPNLFNQEDLIKARADLGVYDVLPGITGLAQLSGVDMSTPERLAKMDKQMIDTLSLKSYFSYIIGTALGKGSGDAVK